MWIIYQVDRYVNKKERILHFEQKYFNKSVNFESFYLWQNMDTKLQIQ